jgi:hypothetical protein
MSPSSGDLYANSTNYKTGYAGETTNFHLNIRVAPDSRCTSRGMTPAGVRDIMVKRTN